MPYVLVWDIETIPDLRGFAAANYLDGKSHDDDDLSQSLALLDRRRLRCDLYRHFDPITSKTWSGHCYSAHRSWPNDRFACIRSIRPVRRSRPSFEHVSVGGRSAAGIRCHPRSALAQKPHVAFGSLAAAARLSWGVRFTLESGHCRQRPRHLANVPHEQFARSDVTAVICIPTLEDDVRCKCRQLHGYR